MLDFFLFWSNADTNIPIAIGIVKNIIAVFGDSNNSIYIKIHNNNGFKKIGINNIVIVGGRDALNAVSILKENNISVILERVHSLPINEDAAIDQFYKLPSHKFWMYYVREI